MYSIWACWGFCAIGVYVLVGADLPQHVGNDEIADVRAADVDLFEMRHATVSGGDGDVLELHVHVVLSYSPLAQKRCQPGCGEAYPR